jgi:hypothetical protein
MRVEGSGSRVESFGYRVDGSGLRDSEFRVKG